jgi:hypothetical protein
MGIEYKNYTIYITHYPDCPDKSTKEVVEKARAKALEEAKKQFPKDIEALIKSKDIDLKKEQTDPQGIQIGINKDKLEDIIDVLVGLESVSMVDAEYCLELPPSKPKEAPKKKKKTKTTKKE